MISKLLAVAFTAAAYATVVTGSDADTAGVRFMAQKLAQWEERKNVGLLPKQGLSSVINSRRSCTGGKVQIGNEDFPCDKIDFEGFIALDDLNIENACAPNCGFGQNQGTTQGSDIWGWESPSGKEITIMCVDNGVWFVDGTDPQNPERVGFLRSGRPQYAWCDVKVYKNVAYIVKDGTDTFSSRSYGIEVFDLTRLESVSGSEMPKSFTPDYVYDGHGNSHNLVVDTESGFLYSVGTGRSTQCRGGLHILNLEPNPLRPTFAGCAEQDGYTHDAQCVVYDGPDVTYQGKQICFAYNEDTLTIWNVDDKNNIAMISRTTYPDATYTHQGWLTADMRYVLLDDELDERDDSSVTKTTTYIFDVSDLDNPQQLPTFIHANPTIDHNLYVWGAVHAKGWGGSPPMANPPSDKYAYLSNYVSGIRVLRIDDIMNVQEVGFFDVAPDMNGLQFEGTWSNYMHPSGVLAVSSIDRGLFFLRPQMAFDSSSPAPTPPPVPKPTPKPTSVDDSCQDRIPSGLQYSNGNPAPCDEVERYCSTYEVVRERCPRTCGECAATCVDKVPSGLSYSDGSSAECSEIESYCTQYDFVREACPATCDFCPASFKTDGKVLVTRLDENVEDPSEAEPGVRFMNQKQGEWDRFKAEGSLPRKGTVSSRNAPKVCTNGVVNIDGENFPCDGVDFLSFISLNELTIFNECYPNCPFNKEDKTTQMSDIWGWLSPTNKEITIECVDNGVWFVDGTDPEDPVRVAFIRSGRPQFAWCDVKVYEDTVYIVKDGQDTSSSRNYGIEVFDLLRLESLDPSGMPYDLEPDFVYTGHGNSHNLVVDTESGVLYSVGTGRSTQCRGGLHMLDIKTNRLRPTFVGCAESDGYTHDAQCVVYDGPDSRYTNDEICFAYNEDTLTIWRVNDKSNPEMLSRTGYTGATYTHQGWLTDDMAFVLLDDELDEQEGVVGTTRTFIFDVSDLRNPVKKKSFDHPDVSIDHNLYVWGAIHRKGWGGNGPMTTPPSNKYAYLSNYVAGLRILDVCDIANGNTKQAGFFDVAPDLTGNIFKGTWSNYMHPSGVVAVSSIERGLFFLKPQMAFDNTPCDTATQPPVPGPGEGTDPPVASTCEDQVPSGISYSDGSQAKCSEIGRYCDQYTFVRERCPKTCGDCDDKVCQDSEPSGLTYTSGAPAPCFEIARYCTSDDRVPEACPKTCGVCRSTLVRFSEFSDLQHVLPAEAEAEEGVLGFAVAGVAAALCVGLAAALLVTRRKLNKMTAQNETPRAISAKLPVRQNSNGSKNPMFETL
uniref:ShKT domain-containing protein n=1 Tax=Aplanochytrium stocchinoi TaxID=215587 RepID=A0A7S3LPK9_9STRA